MLGNMHVTVIKDDRSVFDFTQQLARSKSSLNDSRSFFWKKALPRVRPFYSINCNQDPALLQVLSAFPQMGFHCLTRQNVDTALEFVAPDRLFYANPCWTKATLRHAQRSDVGLVGFESEADLNRMAGENVTSRLILNIALNPNSTDAAAALGCNANEAAGLLATAADLSLNCVGVGFTLGSGVFRAALYEQAIEFAAQLFAVGRSLGLEMSVLNLGGGFPPLTAGFASFETIGAEISSSLDFFFPREQWPQLEIVATPGRFFAAGIFALATPVVGKAEVDASEITNDDFDAGQVGFVYRINEGFYGPFACRSVANCDPKCAPLFGAQVDEGTADLFYGSVLGPDFGDADFDTVQSQCHLRQMSVGEWLYWENLGAYSMENTQTLDDEPADAPQVFYFANEFDWKNIDPSGVDVEFTASFANNSDGDNDSAIDSETDDCSLWLFDLYDD
ncbi:Ornithine decarboxylase [Aphelenchoides fujianensis]|nr:Ornithine decarboxylase [Aphelenchoides fujianensis]